ncbi:MAG: BON domain-containing protein [Alphaproteobacteria bacterium]|nr:BON domain-containing protein [Alphaproteobacteria bacterium]
MKPSYLFLVISALSLSACSMVGVATGVGAGLGVAAAQEGGISRAANDLRIQALINEAWFNYDVEAFTKLDMTVNQGRVLLTGIVQNPEHRVEAVRLAWQPKGVTQVINEIRVAESEGIIGYARDAWISGRLRASITFDKEIESVNYNIDTVQGTIYLMGVAKSQAELNLVVEKARTIPDVRQVVSYVKIAGDREDTYTPDTTSGAGYGDGYKDGYQDSGAGLQPVEQGESGGPVQITPVERESVEWN